LRAVDHATVAEWLAEIHADDRGLDDRRTSARAGLAPFEER
jgi:hypothetical protein